jgi:thioredoxin 2
MSSGGIVVCPQCGAKNRLRSTGAGQSVRCGRCQGALPWLVDADEASFEREVNAPMTVLVDFWAPWCGPCRTVAPVLEELSRDLAGRLKVVKVNVDENPGLAGRYQARSIPLLTVIANGQVRERLLGAQPKSALKRALAPYL